MLNQVLLGGIIESLLLVASILLLILISVLFVECFFSLFSLKPLKKQSADIQPEIAVLIPAHNEASGIQTTIQNIQPQLADQDCILVIADNCTDETAAVARATGVIVIERNDLERRGKGYALDYGLQHLAPNAPDVVIVVDADCIVGSGTISRLAEQALMLDRPVQATYLITPPAHPSPKDAVSAFAITVKNLVRPKGLGYLSLPCVLTGTGMAFPWAVIHENLVASSNIVEDMQLSIDLAIAGYPAKFCPEGLVLSTLPQQEHAIESQRTRWEHGHLQTLRHQVPRLLKQAFHQNRWDLLALALDLSVPPLSLLVMVWVAATAIAATLWLAGLSGVPLGLLAIAGVLLILAIWLAWSKFARDKLPLQMLLSVPLYVLWKIPLYIGFLLRPQTKWVRTERDTISSTKVL